MRWLVCILLGHDWLVAGEHRWCRKCGARERREDGCWMQEPDP